MSNAHLLFYNGISSKAHVKAPDKIVPKTNFGRLEDTLATRKALMGYDNKYIYRTPMYDEIGNVSMTRHIMMPMNDLKISDYGNKKRNPIMRPPKMV